MHGVLAGCIARFLNPGGLVPCILVLAMYGFFPAELSAATCTVRFLDQSDLEEIDEASRPLVIPRAGQYQQAVVQEALNWLPPLICASVGRIVFVDDPDTNAIAYTNTVSAINNGKPADLIYFNNAQMPESRLQPLMVNVANVEEDAQAANRVAAVYALIHEAAHVADHLLDSQRRDPGLLGEDPVDPSLWTGRAVGLAKQAVEQNLLKKGFRQEWIRIHEAFVNAGMARAYYGKTGGMDLKDIPKLPSEIDAAGRPIRPVDRFGRPAMVRPAPIELAGAGFMTRYGGDSAGEDIGEMTAAVLTRTFVENLTGDSSLGEDIVVAIDDRACEALRSLPGPEIPTDVAAVFTKLGYLKSVGFITEEAYRRCIGRLDIRGDDTGFFSYKSGNLDRSYTGNVGGSIGRAGDDGPLTFQFGANGSVGTKTDDVSVRIVLTLNVSPAPGSLATITGGTGYEDLQIEDVSFPRGIYFVGFRHGPYNKLQIIRDDTGGVIMDVGQGVALVSQASRNFIEGSVFVQRYFNFAGGMLSAIAADEPVKQPTTITFRKER